VIDATDGASGLKILPSDVDLLISDVGLPGGMNGRQLTDAGREHRPDLKVLFITGYAENSAFGSGNLAPSMEILTKPFAVVVLAARISEISRVCVRVRARAPSELGQIMRVERTFFQRFHDGHASHDIQNKTYGEGVGPESAVNETLVKTCDRDQRRARSETRRFQADRSKKDRRIAEAICGG
jgi:CheY-like chemotaxis protein